MGQAKQQMERDDENAFLKALTTSGHIDDERAIGTIKQVMDRGLQSRSGKQVWVWNQFVQPLLNQVAKCKGGCGQIPENEKLNALENGGLCSYCEHTKTKNERDD